MAGFYRSVSCRARRSAGFTLFEVLVTVAVFSLGLLGIARLQVLSKHANFEAVQRTMASFLANDILERMRANPESLAAYLASGLGGGTIGSEPTPRCNAVGTKCTTAQLAAHDRWDWERAIDGAAELSGTDSTGGLVSPTGCITGPGVGGAGTYTVALAWRGQAALSNPTASTCGQGSGLYDEASGDNKFRRVLAIDTYISDD